MPRKVFVDQVVLTAAELNDFFMDQSVMVFDTEAARDAAIPTGSRKEGMTAYTKDLKRLKFWNGTRWDDSAGVPVGSIVMWSGTVATIPLGWHLCNGLNGTPNLSGRFIVGATQDTGAANAGSAYNRGAVGGADSVTLATAHMPAHSHTIASSGSHDHTSWWRQTYTVGGTSAALALSNSQGVAGTTLGTEHGGTHTHAVANAGSGQAHENRPLFYALAYIQKM